MSGPKAITIVSIDEVIEICQVLLGHFDAKMEEWIKIGRRNNVIRPSDEAGILMRRKGLSKLFESGQYLSLQKEAPLLIQKLQNDQDQRLEKVAESRIGTQRISRSLSFTAATLLQNASQSGVSLPKELSVVLEKASNGNCEDVKGIEEAIPRVVELTKNGNSKATGFSPMIHEMISSAEAESLDDWIRRNASAEPSDKRIAVAEKLIFQISALDDQFGGDSFHRKLQEIITLQESPHRGLKLDAICLELKTLFEKAKRWSKANQNVAEMRKEAEATGDLQVLEVQFAEFSIFRQRDDIESAIALTTQLREKLAALSANRSAEKKRQAFIQGLTDLGYKVNSGMLKVWTNQKQIVVRKDDNSSTGIELSGNLETGKCQVRVVAFDGQGLRDRESDRREEESWCIALTSLQQSLAARGTELRIEKAISAGAVPLKIVKGNWTDDFSIDNRDGDVHMKQAGKIK